MELIEIINGFASSKRTNLQIITQNEVNQSKVLLFISQNKITEKKQQLEKNCIEKNRRSAWQNVSN